MKAINEAIAGVEDPSEQEVLVVVAELSKKAEMWRERNAITAELAELEDGVISLGGRKAILLGEMNSADVDLANAWKKPIVIAPLALGFLLLVLALKIGAFGLVVGGLGVVVGIVQLKKAKAAPAARKVDVEKKRAEVDDSLKTSQSRIEVIKEKLRISGSGLPNITLGRVAFALREQEIFGRRCLLDQSGIQVPVTLKTVDLDAVGTELSALADAANGIASVPVLLNPRSSESDIEPLERLYGEEDDFKTITNDFTRVIGRVKDVSISLPMVPQSSAIAKALDKKAGNGSRTLPDSVLKFSSSEKKDDAIGEFVRQVNKAGVAGQEIMVALNKTYEALSHVGRLYASARSESLNHLHQEIFDILNRGSWCSKRFFCPRSIQSPAYIHDLIGVSSENAHELPLTELLVRLQRDNVIAERLSAQAELQEQLQNAHRAVQDFEPPVQENGVLAEPLPRYLDDQYREALRQLDISLTAAMFGSATPTLNFAEEARLYYDPETDQWSSDLTPYVYTTGQVQKYGQILKVQNDLLFPIWEHLWTEKADFRKSEMFRTNETLIRMCEKESEKILEVGNQFRSDMRTVREHVYLLESELTSKRDELQSFRTSMGSLDLLSGQQKEILDGQLKMAGSSGDKPVLKDAEERESWLSMEPQNQALRRGTVTDPMSAARLPAILIAYSGIGRPRLTASSGGPGNG